ncbi:thiamine pyrophosphate-binding protein [Mycobacterium sp. KBS0706]|uniref:thiamine pyrophosphate-binding protein n=1 Tax=Mycobacterium sp. KBS0706 TaxID=2578109 RepID=UPI00110F91C8|nr:thiamine pyrophosphate-binding protein [Mycobacterium sp. KBS0706]TSD84626.1 thiamine pyrophosphate-binding protein [Mycobacterium sp. KBS0706]
MLQQSTTYYRTVTDRTVSQLLLDYLKLEDVRYLFGIPGGGIMYLLNDLRLREDEFTYIICRHETGAAYMADGYHRVTGGLGVVLATTGPGAVNALTGVMNAQADHSAVLAITGEVAESYFGKGYLQQGIDGTLNVDAVYQASVQYSAMIASPDDFATLFTQALRDALSIPFRATHISLPVDVSNETPSKPVAFPNSWRNYRTVPKASDRARTGQALDLLLAAKRPLIMLGNGNRFAMQGERRDKFIDFVERFGIPVMTSPDGKALFPETHPLSLRNIGLAGCIWPSLYLAAAGGGPAYDALMVMGSVLGNLATSNWNTALLPQGPLIQVDADQAVIGRVFPIELGIVSELGQFIDDLCELAARRQPDEPAVAERKNYVRWIRDTHAPWYDPEKRESQASPILPQSAMRVINEVVPAGSHIFIDCANCVGWTLNDLAIDPPTQLHLSLDTGPLGFGTCAVVGGKLGAPDRTCIAITGDGAFLMHGSEVSTAVRYGIGAVWIVMDNNDLAMVSQGNAHFFPEPPLPSWTDYYKLGAPDLVAFSTGLGATTYTVRDPEQLRAALARAIGQAELYRRPQVIVLEIDRSEVPPYYRTPPQA